MTYVKMKEVKASLHKAIKYIINPEKTNGYEYVSANFTSHPSDHIKDSKAMLYDIGNCVGGRVENEVLAYHVVQSFAPGETTAEQCHRLGEELAQRITKGEYKYVVATHLDRDHLHNHIIICSANEANHHKMRVIPSRKNGTLKQWQRISDELSQRENLSIITPKEQPAHSEDLGGIYVQVKGNSAKDAMRRRIELALQDSDSYEQFTRTLHDKYGVDVAMRGKHLTFKSLESGFKIRDTKLGQAFDQSNIMARIRHEQVQEITFNVKMIAEKNAETVSVWIPKTHRSERITIPNEYIMTDGKTYRAFLTTNQDQIITDRNGAYKRFAKPDELYANFAPPTVDMKALTEYELHPRTGISEAQQRYYDYQAARLDKLRDSAALLNSLADITKTHTTINDEISRLTREIEQERAEFQAVLIASSENGEDLTIESQTMLQRRENRISDLARRVNALQQYQHDKQRTDEHNDEQKHRRRSHAR